MDTTLERYLRLYDEQLRTEAETSSALSVDKLGPLRLGTFANGRGFITYPRFTGREPQTLAQLAGPALEHFAAQPQISKVEFKTRGHDYAPGLAERLHSLGFVAQETESIMIGPLQALFSDEISPAGVELRRASSADEIEKCAAWSTGHSANPTIRRQPKRWFRAWREMTAWNCGLRGPMGRWPARAAWNPSQKPNSQASGEAGYCPNTAAAASTGLWSMHGHAARRPGASGMCTATAPSIPVRSWSAKDW